jgi:hypothetical protein
MKLVLTTIKSGSDTSIDEVCESCVLNKHHKASYDKEINWKTKKPLKLEHIDMCGPIKPM